MAPFNLSPQAMLLLGLVAVPTVSGHGLISNPPSRNWLCGYESKPHEVNQGGGIHPECKTAYDSSLPSTGGYSFMSVLTHDYGREEVRPLPSHVCGFDSETWNGGNTPWDAAMDWPTTPMAAGINEISWDISWGPHFDDTLEFRYWITKADFIFDPNRELAWTDFETEAFCYLEYNHQNNNNPNVDADVQAVTFHTYCDVPARPTGHHVIYGEWGRNEYTKERFHGCIDVMFGNDGSGSGPVFDGPGPSNPDGGSPDGGSPDTAATTTPGDIFVQGCCTENFKDCVTYAGTTKESCDAHPSGTVWLPAGAPTNQCRPRWNDCTSDANSCCPGLTCVFDSPSYSQCLYVPNAGPTTTTAATTTTTTTTTTDATTSCSCTCGNP